MVAHVHAVRARPAAANVRASVRGGSPGSALLNGARAERLCGGSDGAGPAPGSSVDVGEQQQRVHDVHLRCLLLHAVSGPLCLPHLLRHLAREYP